MSTAPPRPRILVADDDAQTREILGEALDAKGYDVVAVPDGEQALQAAAQTPFALFILDVDMPRLNGIETCRRLRQRPLTQAVPILFLTGLVDPVTVQDAFAAGASDFLPKPVYLPLLWCRVQNLLAVSRLTAELRELRDKVEFLGDKQKLL